MVLTQHALPLSNGNRLVWRYHGYAGHEVKVYLRSGFRRTSLYWREKIIALICSKAELWCELSLFTQLTEEKRNLTNIQPCGVWRELFRWLNIVLYCVRVNGVVSPRHADVKTGLMLDHKISSDGFPGFFSKKPVRRSNVRSLSL